MRKFLIVGLALLVPAVAFAQTTTPPVCTHPTGSAAFRFNRFHNFGGFGFNRFGFGGINPFLGGGYGGGFGSQVILVPQFTGLASGYGCGASAAAFIPQATGCCGQAVVAPQFQQFAAPPVIAQPTCATGLGFNAGIGYGGGLGFNAGINPLLGGGCGVNPAFVGAGLGGFGGYGGFGGFGGGLLNNGFIPNLLSGILGGGFGRGFGFGGHRFHR